jgi:hypothetical protein
MFKYTLTDSTEYVIVKGLVVPKGSEVTLGIVQKQPPSLEASVASFKRLFGIKRKKHREEEDEPVKVVVEEDSESESEESYDESSDEVNDDSDD